MAEALLQQAPFKEHTVCLAAGPVTPGDPELEVNLRRRAGALLGIELAVAGQESLPWGLCIRSIRDDGLVAAWNRMKRGAAQVRAYDAIIQVNGQSSISHMMAELQASQELQVMVRPGPRTSHRQSVHRVKEAPGAPGVIACAEGGPNIGNSHCLAEFREPKPELHLFDPGGKGAGVKSTSMAPGGAARSSPQDESLLVAPLLADGCRLVITRHVLAPPHLRPAGGRKSAGIFRFDVTLENRDRARFGIEVVMVKLNYVCNLIVSHVVAGGVVDQANQLCDTSHRVRPGDYVIHVNSRWWWTAIEHLADEFSQQQPQLSLTLERGHDRQVWAAEIRAPHWL